MKELRPIVLFVDDEDLARRTFQRIVDREFRVLMASNVPEAMEVLDKHHDEIGVLVSDQRMPGQKGVDLLEYCRANYPDIIRMLTTAYSELNDAIAAVNRGEIMRYIEKPWGNIDAILIDLRTAAMLYEIKNENQQLLREKMLAGFRTTRLDRIRSLITVGACQGEVPDLYAVEAMLRQCSEVEALNAMPQDDELIDMQMFGQPIGTTVDSIHIGHYLQREGVSEKQSLPEALAGLSNKLPGDFLASLNTDLDLIFDGEQRITTVSGDDGKEVSQLHVVAAEGSEFLKHWLRNPDVDLSSIERVGALLNIFIGSYRIDGSVKIGFSTAGLVESITLTFSDTRQIRYRGIQAANSYDWIDDLMILFS